MARARRRSGHLCVLRLHGFAASRTRNAAVPSAAPPDRRQRRASDSRRRPAGLGGGVDVGAGAQQRERALGREELEVVERRRPEAGADEPGESVVVAAVGGEVLRRVVRRLEVGTMSSRSCGWRRRRRGAGRCRGGLGGRRRPSAWRRVLVAWFTSAFAASSFATISVCPSCRRSTAGVRPSLSALFTSAFAASSFVTISVWPFWQAMNSGVTPSTPRPLGRRSRRAAS